jgi:hypothetical protein
MVLQEATLTRLIDDKWIWIIRYESRVVNGGATGIPAVFEIVVLMDGHAIMPTQRDRSK